MPPAHREFTLLERHALRWLLRHEKPERLGSLLFDSPFSPKQWSKLLEHYERVWKSLEYERRLKAFRKEMGRS